METNRIFRGFWIKWFGIGPLHYISSRSDFGFEFSEIFVFEKRLPDSTIRGVGDSPYQQYAESATLRINNTGSRRLSASLIRGVDDSPHHRYGESAIEIFKRKLAASVIRRVVDSAYCWYGEWLTPRIVELGSCRLCVSLIRRVASWKKNYFSLDFQYFKRLKHAFKGSIWPDISQGCNLLSK